MTTPSRLAYIARPERRGPSGWTACLPGDTPQRWAVYRETRSRSRNGNLIRSLHFVATFTNQTLATEDALRRTKLVHGNSTARTLGGRFGAIGKVIAGSIDSPWAKGERK